MMNSIFLIGICVVLPIIVVFLNNRTSQNETNKKTEVLLKSIEAGAKIDPEYFNPKQKEKTLKEKLLARLTGACILTTIGIGSFLSRYFLVIWPLMEMTVTEVQIYRFLSIVGGIILAVGIGLFISYFVGKRLLAKELKAEEESLKSEK
ncbi:MAG: hypothetical protein IK038_10835 [Bacteroidaceae bacterium]|nr:hypothetical protein [Bacteroidaceae bacterium]